jgi:heme exporter protein B
MNAFFMILQRDLLLVMRRKSEVLTALFFFVIVTSLFPLGIGADTALLRKIAPGVIWVSALLATLLGLQRLFASDYLDGTLEQLALSPRSFVVLVLGKITAHWLVCGLPLLILAPVIGLQFDLDTASLETLLLTLLLGTPVLSLIGSIGAALTLGWWGADESSCFTPLHPSTDLRGGSGICQKCWARRHGTFFSLGRLIDFGFSIYPLG